MLRVWIALIVVVVIAVPALGLAGSFASDPHGQASLRHMPPSPGGARLPATSVTDPASLLPGLDCLGWSIASDPVTRLRSFSFAPFVPPRTR
jgi:hypothetical protein